MSPDMPLSSAVLLEVATGRRHPLAGRACVVVGRREDADVVVSDPGCSRSHFQIVPHAGGHRVEPLNERNPTFLNGLALAGPVVVPAGAELRAGPVVFRYLADPPVRVATPVVDGSATVTATAGQLAALGAAAVDVRLAGRTVIGRDGGCDVVLTHPQVSRRHAIVTVGPGGAVTLEDLGSANGTFVNGQRVGGRPVRLADGDHLDVGPFELELTGLTLTSRSRAADIELVARDVRRVVTDRQTGRPLTLLDDVTLVFKPREFVCLLGPSGSGKSTLMTILAGRASPDGGAVGLNGQDLHAHFDALKQGIALVPQKNIVHEGLSVGQALTYTAKLRLPPDTSPAEAEACIAEMLDTVGLAKRRGTVIRDLSGGQLKRASLANEILCKPGLLFLDEVTSGLDERTDRDMMALFRSVADSGKTVVCVTHTLAHVARSCTLIVVLTPGGRLAFVGPPDAALGYFNIRELGEVYDRLGTDEADWVGWRDKFLDSPEYREYVLKRLPPASADARPARGGGAPVNPVRQTALLVRRSLAIWRRAPGSLLAMAGQSVLVAALLGVVFGDLSALKDLEYTQRTVNFLFLLAVSSFWFGCNNAAKEIVKERPIFTCERDFNLLAVSYYASKLAVLATFSAVQVLILYALAAAACHPAGAAAGHVVVLLALAFAGTALGLLISAASPSEEMAVTLIPIAVIPQIVLSGAIAPLSGFGRFLARVGITTYWGKRGLDGLLPDPAADKVWDVARNMKLTEDGSTGVAVAVIALHAAAYVAAGLTVLVLQSRAVGRVVHRVKRAAGLR